MKFCFNFKLNILTKILFAIFTLSISLSSYGDTENFFDKTKWSSEALTAGLNSCISGFKKNSASQNKFANAKSEQLTIHNFCGCMMDASQTLGISKAISQKEKCLDYSKTIVSKYLSGNTTVQEQNLFDSNDLPASSVFTIELLCSNREKNGIRVHKNFSELLFCSCATDYARGNKDFRTDAYIKGGMLAPNEVLSLCYEKSKSAWTTTKNTPVELSAPKEPSSNQEIIATKETVESKDGWEMFKVACIGKFKGKEKLDSIKQKCTEMMTQLKSNKFGIAPFSTSEISEFPKIKKGMSKADLLKNFGKPERVSDDGKSLYFKSKVFCSSYDFTCIVYFDSDQPGVSSWHDIKFEFTNNLDD